MLAPGGIADRIEKKLDQAENYVTGLFSDAVLFNTGAHFAFRTYKGALDPARFGRGIGNYLYGTPCTIPADELFGDIGRGSVLFITLAGPASALPVGGEPFPPNSSIVVRGGRGEVPPAGTTFSGAYGATLEEAASGVPHGTIRSTTAGAIRSNGGSVIHAPELTKSGVMNNLHVNITEGGPTAFSDLFPNPVPRANRVK